MHLFQLVRQCPAIFKICSLKTPFKYILKLCFTKIFLKVTCDGACRLKVLQFTENKRHYQSLPMGFSTIFGTVIVYHGEQNPAVVFDI